MEEIIRKYFLAWIQADMETDFDKNMKITKLCEFQSKAEHYYPYGA